MSDHRTEATAERRYSFGEELAHTITHGLGVVLAIAGLAGLTARSALYGDVWQVVGATIFGATLVLMYTASTLYHSMPMAPARKVLRVLDHSAIYLLIAGTYTPFTLVTLHGAWGWTLLGTIWGLAIVGVGFKIVAADRFRRFSLVLYAGMGWCAVVAIRPLVAGLDTGGLVLLVVGGLSYTVGIAFYVWERLPYHHAVWHGFVLAGSVLHYFAVLFYVIPRP